MSHIMGDCARTYKDVFEQEGTAAKLGFMGFFTKACVQALKDIPAVQRRDRRHRPDLQELLSRRRPPSGTDKGLVVPVGCATATTSRSPRIEKSIADFGKAARADGQLKIDEMQGGHFLRSPIGGIYGSLMSTPDPERAAGPAILGNAQDPGTPDGDRRQGRNTADDVPGAVLPTHRRHRTARKR